MGEALTVRDIYSSKAVGNTYIKVQRQRIDKAGIYNSAPSDSFDSSALRLPHSNFAAAPDVYDGARATV